MKKRIFAGVLAALMVATCFVGCKKKPAEPQETTPQPTEAPTQAPGEELPEAKYYFSFDEADGTNGIAAAQKGTGTVDVIEKDVVFIPGVNGQAVYTDGISGYKLTDVNGVGETYTVSFWTYATRLATYMPCVQFGPDVHGDATGSQHYLNITRAEWAGEPTFPCIWSYDQADDGLWPWWADLGTGEMMKQWVMITLVVDEKKVSADGATLNPQLYINGKEYVVTDSDGAIAPINIVKGTMAPSENFDFLLGVNYWDATFKGAYDDLFIFDKALTAGQVATLYARGNAGAAFDEPEHDFTIVEKEGAIANLGAKDFSKADDVYAEDIAIADGQTMGVTLGHWSNGEDAANNYYFIFKDADGNEVARLTADLNYSLDGGELVPTTNEMFKDGVFQSWGNWKTWASQVMKDADVTALITLEGDTVTVSMDNVDYNETSNTAAIVLKTNKPVASFTIGTKKSFTQILSIKDKTVNASGIIVGNTDCSSAWWADFSDIFEIPAGQTVTKTFTNFTNGANVWNNFCVILQTTPTGHSADTTEGYAEYGVVRSDNWGWGAGVDGNDNFVKTTTWNFDDVEGFKKFMDGAKITVSITNNNGTTDIVAVYEATDGRLITQTYTGILSDGPVYACFVVDGAYIVFDTATVGKTDCSSAWWSDFSSIYAVPNGGSKTIYFKNYTSGANIWNNFNVVLQNTAGGHSADQMPGYAEYAVMRTDNWGWGAGWDGNEALVSTLDAVDDAQIKETLDGAYVALTVTNNGTTADISAVITGTNGVVLHREAKNIKIDGDLFFCLVADGSYFKIEAEKVGAADCSAAWWAEFSNIWNVPAGATVAKTLTNYTNGINVWNNFNVVLQTTPTGHSADTTEGYAEYGVVRSDNWGWGAGVDGNDNFVKTTTWNFDDADGFKTLMDGASVTVCVTNNGSTADVVAVYTAVDGRTVTQSYTGITVTGDLYFCFVVDGASILIQ